MKKIANLFACLILVSLMLTSACFAQQKAITETGEEVILYDDGSWKYTNESEQQEKEIKTNPETFEKSANATFLLKSTKVNVGFWLDPKKWNFKKAESNSAAEYELQLKGSELYGMIIAEQVEFPLTALRQIAFDNGRAAAPDVHIAKEEYRIVNGIKVLLLQMNGTMQGVKFSYYGYYFSNSNGSVQFVAYTSQNLLKRYQEEIEEFLNGLVELETGKEQPKKEVKEVPEEKVESVSSESETVSITLSKEDILKLQEKLTELGYNPGPIDGAWGKKTEEALKQFQKDQNLSVTGKLDEETTEKLGL